MSSIFKLMFSKKARVMSSGLYITNQTAINLNAFLAHTGPADLRNVYFTDDIMGDRNEIFLYDGKIKAVSNIGFTQIIFTRQKFNAPAPNVTLSKTDSYDAEIEKGSDKEIIVEWIRAKLKEAGNPANFRM